MEVRRKRIFKNYLLNLVLECQREKWFDSIYSDAMLACNCGKMYLKGEFKGVVKGNGVEGFLSLSSDLIVETLEMDAFAQGGCGGRRGLSAER